MSAKRTKAAKPRGCNLTTGDARMAMDRLRFILDAVGPRNDAKIAMQDALARVETPDALAPDERADISAWLRRWAPAFTPTVLQSGKQHGPGRPVDPLLSKAASDARFDIDHFDHLRSLGYGKVPSDRVALDAAVEREWPDAVRNRTAISKRDALKKAVQRRR